MEVENTTTEEHVESVEGETNTEEFVDGDLVVESNEEESYTPNFNYKVKDEERAFDERLHGVIKSKEDEDFIRELYTKADGLPLVKENLTSIQGELDEYKTGFNNLYSGFEKIKTLRDSGDIRGLMSTIGLTDEQLLEYAIEMAKEETLPEEQRSAIRGERESNSKIQELERRLQNYEATINQNQEKEELNQMKAEMERPEYKPVLDALRTHGKDVDQALIAHGNIMFRRTNKYPTVQEVVKSYVDENSFISSLVAQPAQEEVTTINRQATLPKVRQAGSSPVETQISSIDDLKKLRDAML